MRNLERNCGPFSSKVTSTSGAACAQVIAAKKPAAPPPATTTRRELMRKTVPEGRVKVSPLKRFRSQAIGLRKTCWSVRPLVFSKARLTGPQRAARPQTDTNRYEDKYSQSRGRGCLGGLITLASVCFAQTAPAAEPYKILKTTQTMGTGGIDYVYADNDNRDRQSV